MILYFDTETTGLYPGSICQLSYVMQTKNGVSAKNKFFTVAHVDYGAYMVHGFSVEKLLKLSGGKRFSDAFDEINEDFIRADAVVAHNCAFDFSFMRAEYERLGKIFAVKKEFCSMKKSVPVCKLAKTRGAGYKYPKLYAFHSRLLKAQNDKDSSKLSERIKKELSGLSSQIMFAIMHNTPLPDTVAAKALAYIRSDILSDPDDETKPQKTTSQKAPDRIACQILKAWLNRRYKNQKKEEFLIMDRLNPQSPSAAYQAGRLMAEYAAIQSDALGDVNAGVVERYYTSACASPALVMGKLSTLSQYHLSKLKGEKKWLYDIHSQTLEEISCKIGEALPKRFSLEQQSEFALGYYFQCSEIRSRKSKKSEE